MLLKTFSYNIGEDVKCYNHHEILLTLTLRNVLVPLQRVMLLKTLSFNIGEDVKCYNHHEILPYTYLMKRISTITKGDVTQNVLLQYW